MPRRNQSRIHRTACESKNPLRLLIPRPNRILGHAARPLIVCTDGIFTGEDTPVIDVVKSKAFVDEEALEQLPQVRIVGLFVESESATVVHVAGELDGETSAELFSGSGHLCHAISTHLVRKHLRNLLFSMIQSCFCFLVADLRPCHGSWPRRKYWKHLSMYTVHAGSLAISTYPNDSRSSRLDCSTPRWLLIEEYRAVPIRSFFSRNGM